jgi:hypothetical protein
MDLYDHMYLWSQRSIKFNFIGIRSNFAGENIEKPPADYPPRSATTPQEGNLPVVCVLAQRHQQQFLSLRSHFDYTKI